MKSSFILPILISLGAAWAQPPQPAALRRPTARRLPLPRQRHPRRCLHRREPAVPPWNAAWKALAAGGKTRKWCKGLASQPINRRRWKTSSSRARLRLIDLNAALQKEEATMEPLMAADQPDDARLLAQVDKVAQARAELEKANGRMLVGMRRVLTPDQWKKLQAVDGPGGRVVVPCRAARAVREALPQRRPRSGRPRWRPTAAGTAITRD